MKTGMGLITGHSRFGSFDRVQREVPEETNTINGTIKEEHAVTNVTTLSVMSPVLTKFRHWFFSPLCCISTFSTDHLVF